MGDTQSVTLSASKQSVRQSVSLTHTIRQSLLTTSGETVWSPNNSLPFSSSAHTSNVLLAGLKKVCVCVSVWVKQSNTVRHFDCCCCCSLFQIRLTLLHTHTLNWQQRERGKAERSSQTEHYYCCSSYAAVAPSALHRSNARRRRRVVLYVCYILLLNCRRRCCCCPLFLHFHLPPFGALLNTLTSSVPALSLSLPSTLKKQ